MCYTDTSLRSRQASRRRDERKQAIMVLKATNNSSSLAYAVQSKRTGRQAPKKGSRVTQERAKAQRVKLDAQAETQPLQEEQEAVVQAMQRKKTGRQEVQAKRRLIDTLIEAYL